MKDLLLLRHAKSSWATSGQADIDRPLNKRGRKAAVRLVKWFKTRKCRPALVLCSPAKRTRETLDLIQEAWSKPPEIHYQERLYLADAEDLLQLLRDLSDAIPSALVIGHNPGIQELALALLPEAAEATRTRIDAKLPTGALLRLSTRGRSWSKLGADGTKLVEYITPAELSA